MIQNQQNFGNFEQVNLQPVDLGHDDEEDETDNDMQDGAIIMPPAPAPPANQQVQQPQDDDSDDECMIVGFGGAPPPNPADLDSIRLVSMGYPRIAVDIAMQIADNNFQRALKKNFRNKMFGCSARNRVKIKLFCQHFNIVYSLEIPKISF